MKDKLLRVFALVLGALTLFGVASCDKIKEKPEAGRYYRVENDGNHYFVWLDHYDKETAKGHYYAATGDSVAIRHNFTASLSRRSIFVHSEETIEKVKTGDISYEPYIEPPFEEGDWELYRKPFCPVSVTGDICYGRVEGYWTSLAGVEQDIFKLFTKGYFKSFRKRELDLKLDLYRPEGLSGKRPLILFIHGGAFYIGYKDEPAYIDFCKYFASMGYVTASIDYRLGFHISKNEIERAGYVALQDAHAALRYLVAHAEEYNIDTDMIYVAGSSAGGITALNLAFMSDDERPGSSRGKKAFLVNKADLGGIASSGNDLRDHFNIVAIANMWGAVADLNILDNSHTAIVSFHGDRDYTVPYGEGYPLSGAGEGIAKLLSEKMYGSSCIDRKAEEVGLRHHFYSFPGEAHAFNTDKNKQPNDNHTFIKERINDFFFEEMVPVQAAIRADGGGCYSVTGRGISDVQWKVEGGFILSSGSGKVRVLWCADKPHNLTAAGKYNNSLDWLATL